MLKVLVCIALVHYVLLAVSRTITNMENTNLSNMVRESNVSLCVFMIMLVIRFSLPGCILAWLVLT
jgi:hypothetical protein